jgi:glycine oxidase
VSGAKISVVGGGVIGLVTAFLCADAGNDVTLFDPHPGRGATWAAAGMIAPHAEIVPGEIDNFRLQSRALSAWQELSSRLCDLTSHQIAIATVGTLYVGWDASDRRAIDQFVAVATSFGVTPQYVTREDNSELFEGLSHRIPGGVLLTGDAWVNPDEIVKTLIEALGLLGVEIIRESVIEISETATASVSTQSSTWHGEYGVLATGAFASVPGVNFDASVRPVRGTTVRVQGLDRSHLPMVRAVVHGRAFYYVSRSGGYGVVGASSDEQPTPVAEVGELQRLLRDAVDVVPALESAAFLESRSGLRPCDPSGEPFLSRSPGGRWWWSSGHYRHGVTLAPLAGAALLEGLERL